MVRAKMLTPAEAGRIIGMDPQYIRVRRGTSWNVPLNVELPEEEGR